MDKEVLEMFGKIESRLSLLEQGTGLNEEGMANRTVIELDLTLPEADIGGLNFNEQKVHGIFEMKEDDWYHSRDILFLSARKAEDGNSRDILSWYLNSEDVKKAFDYALAGIIDGFTAAQIIISLPKENQGIKKYNGVRWRYWLRPPSSASAANFWGVGYHGASGDTASAVGGVAPAFCVAGWRHTKLSKSLPPCGAVKK
jgi:hypothetical protein